MACVIRKGEALLIKSSQAYVDKALICKFVTLPWLDPVGACSKQLHKRQFPQNTNVKSAALAYCEK